MRYLAASVVLLAGCAVQSGRSVPPECKFPEAVRLTFAGETTMDELGIPDPGGDGAPVYAWVTRDPISFPSTSQLHRAACVERADGSFERSAFPGALLRTAAP